MITIRNIQANIDTNKGTLTEVYNNVVNHISDQVANLKKQVDTLDLRYCTIVLHKEEDGLITIEDISMCEDSYQYRAKEYLKDKEEVK